MAISAILADGQAITRRGMRSLLESERCFSIVGEAADGLSAVELIERLQPDVAILDFMMPALGGLDALRVIRERAAKTAVMVLSACVDNPHVAEALQNGVTAYLLKTCSPEEFVHAVKEAAAGRRFLSPAVSQMAIDAYVELTKASIVDPHETLTTREREVLQLTAEGKLNTEVAVRLHISPRTVENHRSGMMRKLGLKNYSELVRYAVRRGLIPLEV